MKSVIPVVLAVVFSNTSLAGVKQPDVNKQLQQHQSLQTSLQAVIDARLEPTLNTLKVKTAQFNEQRLALRVITDRARATTPSPAPVGLTKVNK